MHLGDCMEPLGVHAHTHACRGVVDGYPVGSRDLAFVVLSPWRVSIMCQRRPSLRSMFGRADICHLCRRLSICIPAHTLQAPTPAISNGIRSNSGPPPPKKKRKKKKGIMINHQSWQNPIWTNESSSLRASAASTPACCCYCRMGGSGSDTVEPIRP